MAITILFIVGWRWQFLSFVTLAALALTAYNFPKIGTDYMPPLDEGSILDMPVTVPRVSVTEAADDLKARDALIAAISRGRDDRRQGGPGRHARPTPRRWTWWRASSRCVPRSTGPSGSSITRTPSGRRPWCWLPCRSEDLIEPIPKTSPNGTRLLDPATMNAVSRFDETMRELVLQRFTRVRRASSARKLLREFIAELVGRWQKAGRLLAPVDRRRHRQRLAAGLRNANSPRSSPPVPARRTSTA